jgi:hypothetical protein
MRIEGLFHCEQDRYPSNLPGVARNIAQMLHGPPEQEIHGQPCWVENRFPPEDGVSPSGMIPKAVLRPL